MPANKAVLRDIHDLGLDPRVAHGLTTHDGRLTATPKAGQHINQRELPKKEALTSEPMKVAAAPTLPTALPVPPVKVEPKAEDKKPEPVKAAPAPKKKEEPKPEASKAEAKLEEKKPVAPAAVETAKPAEKPTDEKPIS